MTDNVFEPFQLLSEVLLAEVNQMPQHSNILWTPTHSHTCIHTPHHASMPSPAFTALLFYPRTTLVGILDAGSDPHRCSNIQEL